MDRFAEKQIQIRQQRVEASARYPRLWSDMITEWNSPGPDDRAWLMYSANYLFRTNNVRWAIDPLTLHWRMKSAPKVDVVRDLSNLTFVLLTHSHGDHLDLELLSALRHLPITWIVPDCILSTVVRQAGLPQQNIIVPDALEPIEVNGIRILPFDGLHWETLPDGTPRGVPAAGYLIEFNGKRWLFPGDTRTYDASKLPQFGPMDGLFAHVWLGRGCALMDSPPLSDLFCRFFLDLLPDQIILTHLNEFGRDAYDFWDVSHVQNLNSKFQEISPGVFVIPAFMGEKILLENKEGKRPC